MRNLEELWASVMQGGCVPQFAQIFLRGAGRVRGTSQSLANAAADLSKPLPANHNVVEKLDECGTLENETCQQMLQQLQQK